MSCISYGAVFGRAPLCEADLAEIDRVLAEHAERLVRTRKGRVWKYIRGDVVLGVQVEEVERVLWDCEDDLLSLGLLPELACYRVSFIVGYCGDEADGEIRRLIGPVDEAVGGVSIGPRRSH
jgi:hypothetical protein